MSMYEEISKDPKSVLIIIAAIVVSVITVSVAVHYDRKVYYSPVLSNMVDEEWGEYLNQENIQSVTLTREDYFGDCSLEIDFVGDRSSFQGEGYCLGLGEVSIRIEDGESKVYIPEVNEQNISSDEVYDLIIESVLEKIDGGLFRMKEIEDNKSSWAA